MDYFVAAQITKIGKVTVRLEPTKYTEMVLSKDSWTRKRGTVNSMQLGSIIFETYSISRQRPKQPVEADKIKVNQTKSTRPDFIPELLDIISVRDYDRVQIQELEGETGKEKCRVSFSVLCK